MLKKGQPKWWDNRKPVAKSSPLLSHVVDRDGNMMNVVRWPARKMPRKKRYGIGERWNNKSQGLFGGREWYYWYRTAGDRDQALIALRKQRWAHKRTFRTVER